MVLAWKLNASLLTIEPPVALVMVPVPAMSWVAAPLMLPEFEIGPLALLLSSLSEPVVDKAAPTLLVIPLAPVVVTASALLPVIEPALAKLWPLAVKLLPETVPDVVIAPLPDESVISVPLMFAALLIGPLPALLSNVTVPLLVRDEPAVLDIPAAPVVLTAMLLAPAMLFELAKL